MLNDMWMIIALSSIVVLAGVGFAARKLLGVAVCPICAGVAGTWGWMLIGHYAGYAVDMTAMALLMGGSPVGIAYVLEKRLPAGRSPIWWKFLAIPAGFAAMYGLLMAEIFWIIGGAIAWFTVAAVFFRKTGGDNERVGQFEKGLENCC